jgi:NADH:ubiquinone oxidoreductase subunit 6 (subunit J)
MELTFLYVFAAITLAGALGVLLFKTLLHAILSFIITLLGVAVLFLFSGAEFLAVTQIMIYAGGILILLLFGLMLTSKIGSILSNSNNSNLGTACLIALLLFGFFTYKIMGLEPITPHPPARYALKKIGFYLLSEHLFTFEAITILLVISLIGAAIISRGLKDKDA